MPLSIKTNGQWQSVSNLFVKTGGAWQSVAEGWIKSGGQWLKIWPGGSYWWSRTTSNCRSLGIFNTKDGGYYEAGTYLPANTYWATIINRNSEGEPLWAKVYYYSVGDEGELLPGGLHQDASGNIIMFTNISRIPGTGNQAIVLSSIDKNGGLNYARLVYQNCYGRSHGNVMVDANNEYVLWGAYQKNQGSDWHVWVAKLNSVGAVIWNIAFNANTTSYGEGHIDAENNINLPLAFNDGLLAVKISQNGKILRAVNITSSTRITPSGMAKSGEDIYWGGTYTSPQGGTTGLVGKLDKDFNLLWSNIYWFTVPLYGPNTQCRGIYSDNQGFVYLNSNYWIYYDQRGNDKEETNAISQYTKNGNHVWSVSSGYKNQYWRIHYCDIIKGNKLYLRGYDVINSAATVSSFIVPTDGSFSGQYGNINIKPVTPENVQPIELATANVPLDIIDSEIEFISEPFEINVQDIAPVYDVNPIIT